MGSPEPTQRPTPQLVRGMSLRAAIAVNMIDMIGVGPFITLPLIVAAMGGPQAMLGWILGAVFAMCDGLIWSELGAAFPGAGGSYRYLSEAFGPKRWGRLFSFLFVWQLSFSAPLSIASGCIGLAMYATFFFPGLDRPLFSISGHTSLLGGIGAGITVSAVALVAVTVCLLALWLAYRQIGRVGRISQYLWVVVLATVGWVIVTALTHFNAHQAFAFPAHAFSPTASFFLGMGTAMLIATYDYWGYYNIGFLGGEVEQPERNIPRAILWSIALVAAIYIVMNIGVLGVLPWKEMISTQSGENYVISVFMERVYGSWAAHLVTVLIMWTAFASVFSLLLGYSRVPYAAAVDGNYFKGFAHLHPRGHFPNVSMLWLGGVAALCCFFSLVDVIAALVVIRIALQFLVQAIGLIVLRVRRPDLPRPFKMWWYPVPVVLAILGFIYVLFARTHSIVQLRFAMVILLVGLAVYGARELAQRRRRA
ncbi:MAG TPA: APC family permease [Terriglobales bacterium]|jgi:amino acid transporter